MQSIPQNNKNEKDGTMSDRGRFQFTLIGFEFTWKMSELIDRNSIIV